MPIFLELSTPRLLLRPRQAHHAAELEPILAVNEAHLAPWIPAHIAKSEPVPRLVERLTGFAAEFSADQKWRFAMFARADGQLLGELGLFRGCRWEGRRSPTLIVGSSATGCAPTPQGAGTRRRRRCRFAGVSRWRINRKH